MSAEVQPLAISIMVLFYLWRLWSSHTLSHLSVFLWADFLVLPHLFSHSCHGDQLLFFLYSHTASTIVVLSFVCDWLILSAGDAVAVLPQSVAVRCCSCGVFTDSPWWVLSVSGWHTQFHHLRVFFRLVPHFVPQLSTLPSLTVIIFIFFTCLFCLLPTFLLCQPLHLSSHMSLSSLSHAHICVCSCLCIFQCIVGEGCCC